MQHPTHPSLLLYQCPDCCTLRRTWSALKQHCAATRHGCVLCLHCKLWVPPHEQRVHFTRSACADAPVHAGGDFLTAKKAMVVVDPSRADVVRLVDEDDCSTAAHNDDMMLLLQCPVCFEAFADDRTAVEHLESSQHGVVQCSVEGCGARLCVWSGEVGTHAHHGALSSDSPLHGRSCLADFAVRVPKADALRWFPHALVQCARPTCSQVLPATARHHFDVECGVRDAAERAGVVQPSDSGLSLWHTSMRELAQVSADVVMAARDAAAEDSPLAEA